jgi:uncharacterized protein YegL
MRSLWIPSLVLSALAGAPLMAQTPPGPGPMPPSPRPLRVTQQAVIPHVNVKAVIDEGVASVDVALTLENQGKGEAEYVLAFPLPPGAVADRLQLKIDGKMEEGELSDAKAARGIYMAIVRKRRDPALLEYAGRGLVRLRVFPIPGGGKREVALRYRQVLPQSGGLWNLSFPTRAFGEGRFAMDVQVKTKHGLRNVYAPTSGWDIVRKGEREARASFESKVRPTRDPQLFYSMSDAEFGLSMLSYKKQGEPGYFLLLLSPKRDAEMAKELKKSVTFVVDTSGSMRGQKIEQAKGALRYFVSKLKDEDEFNIVAFSTEARLWKSSLTQANAEMRKDAEQFIDGLGANGGTNIHDALTSALTAQPKQGNVPMLVFLTDGLASVGIQQPKEILAAVKKANAHETRIFAFGVGNDVNTFLIDSLCEETRGTRDYVAPQENIEVKVSALFDKIAHPVLSDLKLECAQVEWDRMAPSRLPDLFLGEQLVVAGRYKQPGDYAIRLHGRSGDTKRIFTFDAGFAKDGEGQDFVPSIWAQRRVGFLLDQMRLHGQNGELINEIKILAEKHGIVTPYSSQLVLEPGMQADDFDMGRSVRRRGGSKGGPGGNWGGRRAGGPTTGAPSGPTTPGPAGPSTSRPGGIPVNSPPPPPSTGGMPAPQAGGGGGRSHGAAPNAPSGPPRLPRARRPRRCARPRSSTTPIARFSGASRTRPSCCAARPGRTRPSRTRCSLSCAASRPGPRSISSCCRSSRSWARSSRSKGACCSC